MILHLAEDEKFIDHAIDVYENAAPGNNLFLIDSGRPPEELTLIKRKEQVQCVRFSELLNSDLEQLKRFDFVVLHGMNMDKAKIVVKAPAGVKFVWSMWGYDVYSALPEFIDFTWDSNAPDNAVRSAFDLITRDSVHPYYQINQAALLRLAYRRVCLCTMSSEYEFNTCRQRMPYLKAKYLQWPYNIVPEQYAPLTGDNILLGNSASSSNNHRDAFLRLAQMDLGERKVITPLSYGDKCYALSTIEQGRKILGERFFPLTEMLPLPEYSKIVNSCSVVIMNHSRQQGFGNILIAMNSGARIYLREENIIYRLFNDFGGVIFSIQRDLSGNNPEVFSLLPEEQREQNRKVLLSEYGRDTVLKKTGRLIETVMSLSI